MGVVLIDRGQRLTLVAHHQAEDGAPVMGIRPWEIHIERQLVLAGADLCRKLRVHDALVIRAVRRDADGANPRAEHKLVVLLAAHDLADIHLFAAGIVHLHFLAVGVHHLGAVPGVAGVADAVGHISVARLSVQHHMIHHAEFRARVNARRPAQTGQVQVVHGRALRHLRGEVPDAVRSAGADHHGLGLENAELTCSGVHAGGADDTSPLLSVFRQEGGDRHTVDDLDALALHLAIHAVFDPCAVDADHESGFVVIGEHQSGLRILPLGAVELAVQISDLNAHLLRFQQGIPALLGGDIAGDAVGIAAALFQRAVRIVLRRHCGAGVRQRVEPVVNARTAAAASSAVASVRHDDGGAILCRLDRRSASRDAAADDQDIGFIDILFAVIHLIRPVRSFSCLHYIFMPIHILSPDQ